MSPNESIGNASHFEYVSSGFPKTINYNGAPNRSLMLNAAGDITVKRVSDGASVPITGWPGGIRLPIEVTEITSCTVSVLVLY